jgi:hypothetical protein
MNTRKYPRTLNEAFGPYTSTHFVEDKQPEAYGWVWWACIVVILMLTVLLIGVTR